jgi:hypothetical protein
MDINGKRAWLVAIAVLACFTVVGTWSTSVSAQNKIMGVVEFKPDSKAAKTSGVWIDGQYVGYLQELKGRKKLTLLPGEHDLSVRQAGYEDFNQKIVIEPDLILSVSVKMQKAADAVWPTQTAELKVDVHPDRAAVFVDDKFLGHAGELGGRFHSMLLGPGHHRIKVELPGYRTFESDVTLVAGQKSVVKTDLAKGSITQADTLIKEPTGGENKEPNDADQNK